MIKQEQIAFVEQLGQSVLAKIKEEIEKGKIPQEWDGHELRQLMADRFAAAVFIKMDKRRKREYDNTVLVNNL